MKKIIFILFTSLLIASCGKDFLDVNTSPNNPSQSTPEVTLPVAQKTSASIVQGGYSSMNTIGNVMMYIWASGPGGVWYTNEMALNVTSNFHNEIWDYTYATILKNYKYVAEYEGEGYDNYKAIAKIMMAYHFQILVDTYGDIPFTDALQRAGNTRPEYDDDAFVYEQLNNMLKEAVDMINNAPPSALSPNGNQDVMMAGDMMKWKKFANTLRMKLMVRQSNVLDLATIQNTFADIATEGSGFLGSGESVYCNPGYLKVSNKQNPFWASYGEDTGDTETLNWKYTKATDYLIDYMVGSNDFRMDAKFDVNTNSGFWKGFPQGAATAGEDNSDYSSIAKESLGSFSGVAKAFLRSSEQDAIIFTAAESLLLQAEAIQRTYMAGDAEATYREGVISSFAEHGFDSSFAEASYLDVNGGDPGINFTLNPIQAIITQKYIHLAGINGLETWFEFNRTGYPDNIPFSATAISTTRPVRLLYPNSEISNNSGNVPAQTNSDAFSSPVFWDN
jgi:hypothetical protein